MTQLVNPIQVLLIEDNPTQTQLLKQAFAFAEGGPFHVTSADRLQAGLRHLAQSWTDVILLDLGLPDSQGLETFTTVQAQAPQARIVVLTGLTDEATAIEAVRLGAQDYLLKTQVTGRLLSQIIQYAVESTWTDAQATRQPLHILLVGEELAAFQLAREYLAREAHVVETAASAPDALDRLRSQECDLVLTDGEIRVADGEPLAVAIKELSPDTPVIIVQEYGEDVPGEGALLAGVDLVLTRPLTLTRLQQALRQLTAE